MPKFDVNKVANHTSAWVCSPLNLLHIFRTHFPKSTSEGLLLTCVINALQILFT